MPNLDGSLADFEVRTLELANRLSDMTCREWERVRDMIDRKFERRKKESERKLQLSSVTEEDLYG